MKSITIFETFLFLGAKLDTFLQPYKHFYAKSILTPAFDNLGLQIDTISTFFHTFTLYRLIFIIQSLA